MPRSGEGQRRWSCWMKKKRIYSCQFTTKQCQVPGGGVGRSKLEMNGKILLVNLSGGESAGHDVRWSKASRRWNGAKNRHCIECCCGVKESDRAGWRENKICCPILMEINIRHPFNTAESLWGRRVLLMTLLGGNSKPIWGCICYFYAQVQFNQCSVSTSSSATIYFVCIWRVKYCFQHSAVQKSQCSI